MCWRDTPFASAMSRNTMAALMSRFSVNVVSRLFSR